MARFSIITGSIVGTLAGFSTARVCTNLTIPVNITARQGSFENIPVDGNIETQAFAQAFTRPGQNLSQVLLQDYQTLQGSYDISASFCRPDEGTGSTLQLLYHGIGFDKSYWDLSFNNYNYSYVETAVKQGYSTLAVDRFGIGNSSHGDPINTIQTPAEIAALVAVTEKARNGQLPGGLTNTSFSKIIHVGHSYGSIQLIAFSALYPNMSDGLVLTGYSASSFLATTAAAWNLHSAPLNQPLRLGNLQVPDLARSLAVYTGNNNTSLVQAIPLILRHLGVTANISTQAVWNDIATTEVGDIITGWNQSVSTPPYNYPPGYLVPSDLTALQYTFLYPGYYDIGLSIVAESTKQPVTIGELLTISGGPTKSSFTGPVLVFTGRYDQPFCGGDCLVTQTPMCASSNNASTNGSMDYITGSGRTSIPAGVQAQFPSASAFEVMLQPDTAHGLNLHYNATGFYSAVQSWLGAHGLGV